MNSDPNVPHIAACCADCGFVFDLKFGTDCPSCHHRGVKWAHLVSDEEVQQRGSYAQQSLRHRLDEWADCLDEYQHRPSILKFERKSIEECEAIYALNSEGSRP